MVSISNPPTAVLGTLFLKVKFPVNGDGSDGSLRLRYANAPHYASKELP